MRPRDHFPLRGEAMFKHGMLPENHEYRDTGCNLAPSCLACPFERCRYDDPLQRPVGIHHERDAEIHMMHAAGLSTGEIAQRIGLSKRSVYRVLALDVDVRTTTA